MLILLEVLATLAFLLRSFSVVPVLSRCIIDSRRTVSPPASWSKRLEVLVAKLLSSQIKAVTTSSRSLTSAMPITRKFHSTARASNKSSTLSLPQTSPPGRTPPPAGPGESSVAAVEAMWMSLSTSRYVFGISPSHLKTHLVRRVPDRGTSTCRSLALKAPSCCRRRTSPTQGIPSVSPSPRISTAMAALSRSLWVKSRPLITLTITHIGFSEHRRRIRLQTSLECP